MSRRRSILAAVTVLAAAAAGCSSGDDAPQAAASVVSAEADSELALFDSSALHRIDVSFDTAAYDTMIQTYADSGTKEWIEATVTIDGTTYERAGMRLKGNSSLGGLGGEGRGTASADAPEELPWLIRLNKFVEGQDHQGYEDIVVRSNRSATSLNEAVALDLLEQTGLVSQDAALTRFTVNGGGAVLRLAIEHPDDDAWQEANFEGDGALYKAESTGDWTYRGDDPAAYEEVWDQEGGSSLTDLTPLIGFLQFLNESDDATFAAELPERLDVDAFARYLAMMDLVANADDIDGPGNNAYLHYDIATEQFTVVPWDLNLAFGGMGGGPGGGPGAGMRPGVPAPVQPPAGLDPSQLPEGFEPPAPPDGGQVAEGTPVQRPGGAGRGGFGRSNVLVERFHATPAFEALYQAQLTTLRADLYGTDVAADTLASWVATLTNHATDLVEPTTIESEAAEISRMFTTS